MIKMGKSIRQIWVKEAHSHIDIVEAASQESLGCEYAESKAQQVGCTVFATKCSIISVEASGPLTL